VRELPRQLSADQLAELFEGRTTLVEQLAAIEDPLGRARAIAARLSPDEQKQVLDAHPRIGTRGRLSPRSAAEQGTDDDPEVLRQLAELNREYEARFGFRFVVFVNRRPRRELVPILQERLGRTRDEELATGVDELVQIAIDRWQRTS
jgi:2-oxo-4-hydroxy-4-carboxy--5-ureidoimidazoline (OHCU) decarboxylase